jgi:hypothetical protein
MSYTERLALGVKEYVVNQLAVTKAASRAGVPMSALYQHLKFRNLIRPTNQRGVRVADPDEETIAARAAEIRASWTAEEASRRWVGRSGIRRVTPVRMRGVA